MKTCPCFDHGVLAVLVLLWGFMVPWHAAFVLTTPNLEGVLSCLQEGAITPIEVCITHKEKQTQIYRNQYIIFITMTFLMTFIVLVGVKIWAWANKTLKEYSSQISGEQMKFKIHETSRSRYTNMKELLKKEVLKEIASGKVLLPTQNTNLIENVLDNMLSNQELEWAKLAKDEINRAVESIRRIEDIKNNRNMFYLALAAVVAAYATVSSLLFKAIEFGVTLYFI